MNLAISRQTLLKTTEIYRTKGIVTAKDIPDLDCYYLSDYLCKEIKNEGFADASFHVIKTKFMDFIHVIYDASRYDDQYIDNYVKKLKI